ncbi:MAG: ABC transporter substrate-binding protein [Sphaerochaetaceae bacterium]
MKKRVIVLLMLLCSVFFVFAGGADETSTNDESQTLNIGIQSECVHTMLSFSLTGDSVDYFYSWPVYESLFKPNAEGSVDPWLLESYEMDKENLTYTFNVRKGITFSDGTVFDGAALKWNLDHYLEVGAKVAALLSSIDTVELVDEDTVVLHLKTWSSILPYAYSRECGYMYSPTFYQEHGKEYCDENPCGTGPYVMTEWNYDVSKTFEARSDYWDGPAKIDTVKYVIYTDPLVAQAAMQNGDIDAYLGPDAGTANSLKAAGIEIKTGTVKSHTYMLCFNSLNLSGNDPTGDVRVRKAISYAIDFDALVEAVWGDFAQERNQFGVGQHFYSDSVVGYDYNPEKAKALLAEAGYPNGFTIDLKTEDASSLIDSATIIQQFLSEVGIKANLSILSGADGNAAEAGWGEGLWVHGSSVYVSAPMQMASMFRQNLTGHVLGLTNLLRPDDVEAAIALSVSAASDEEAVEAIGEANRLLTDEYAIVTNFAEVAKLFAVNSYVKDSGIGDTFYSVADLANAWLDK